VRITTALLAATGLIAPMARATDGVPPDLEAAILARALAYDRSLSSSAGDEVTIGVISLPEDPASRRQSEAILEAFKELSGRTIQGLPLRAVAVPWDAELDLKDTLVGLEIDALYLTPGLDEQLDAITTAAQELGRGTLTSVEMYVRNGDAALGVVLSGGRPSLLVNLPTAREEGMDLNSAVLKLAEVIR